jgi:hypothetical protein
MTTMEIWNVPKHMIHTESMLEKSLCLRSIFSTIASTTRSVFFTASFKSREVCSRLSVSFRNVSTSVGLSYKLKDILLDTSDKWRALHKKKLRTLFIKVTLMMDWTCNLDDEDKKCFPILLGICFLMWQLGKQKKWKNNIKLDLWHRFW